jgi:glycosyltransferase involved in cell wall biosynthesis
MIACAFPPTGGPGVQRTFKFAKYLPRFGWVPTVWAAEPLSWLPRDETLLADLPNVVTVFRSPVAPTLERGWGASTAGKRAPPVISHFARAAAARWTHFVRPAPFPDEFSAWARHSVEPLRRRIDAESIEVLYSTFSPASNHLLGLELKRRTGLPWVADFRDLWIDDYRYAEPSARRRNRDAELQQAVFEEADAVVGVTARQTEIFAQYVPDHRAQFITITNGFDPDDFRNLETSDAPDPSVFTIAHIGRLDRWRAKDALLEGLRRLSLATRQKRGRFVFRILGHVDRAALTMLLESGVPCELTGYVSHSQAIREMCRADALLLALPDGPNADSVIPAKLFEYLASGRPILAVGPDGAAADIVRRCTAGTAVGFDSDVIAEALRGLLDAWDAGHPTQGCNPALLTPFSRVVQSARLSSVFDRLVDGPGSSSAGDLRMATGRVR